MAAYRAAIGRAQPVGHFVNDRFGAYTMVHCAETRAKAVANGAFESVRWWYYSLATLTLEWEGALWSAQERADRFPYMEKIARGDFNVEEFDREDMVLVGNPDQLIRKIERYEEIGIDNLLCYIQFGGLPHEHIMQSIGLMGKHVIPHFAKGDKSGVAVG